jgi:diaminopimelate decarboxylase
METSAAFAAAKNILGHPNIELSGVSCHIGSQILDLHPMADAAKLVRAFADSLRALGHKISHIDLGGGLGVAYEPRQAALAPTMKQYGTMLKEAMRGDPARLLIEPGRCLVAEAGVLVTRVIEVKKTGDKTFVLVDAAMNDLVRPSLYEAYHHIVPVFKKQNAPHEMKLDVVGPVCETGDFFAFDRTMELPQDGELLALTHAGAYGYSMASNYNMRPRPPEVAVSRKSCRLIRRRETYADLWRLDSK